MHSVLWTVTLFLRVATMALWNFMLRSGKVEKWLENRCKIPQFWLDFFSWRVATLYPAVTVNFLANSPDLSYPRSPALGFKYFNRKIPRHTIICIICFDPNQVAKNRATAKRWVGE